MYGHVKLLDKNPSVWLAHRFFVLEQYTTCLEIIEQTLKRTPDNPEALSLKGNVLLTLGRVDEALNFFDSASFIEPGNLTHQVEKVRCFVLLGRYYEALKQIEHINSAGGGNDWEVYHLAGQAYLKLKKYDDAVENFSNALDADVRLETILELFTAYEKQKNDSDIEYLIEEAEQSHGMNPLFQFRVASYYMRRKQYQRAQKLFEKIYEKDPEMYMAMLNNGSIQQFQMKDKRALSCYRRAYQGLPNSPALWNNVSLLINERSPFAAALCVRKALSCTPFEGVALLNLGNIQLEQKMWCSAVLSLKRALRASPSTNGIRSSLGLALMNSGHPESAIKFFTKELQDNRSHQLLANTAICYVRLGNNAEAIPLFTEFFKAVEDEPLIGESYPLPLLKNLFAFISK